MFQNVTLRIKKKFRLTNDIKEYQKKGVTLGDGVSIYNSYLDVGHGYLIEIGDHCTLTNCTILAHDASTQIYFKKSKVGMVRIGSHTFIGWGAIILPHVSIGKNCIIGAGTVVSKDIPDNSVVIGSPCRIISTTEQFILKHQEYMKEKPIFEKKWNCKTKEQKNREKEILQNTFGYDE